MHKGDRSLRTPLYYAFISSQHAAAALLHSKGASLHATSQQASFKPNCKDIRFQFAYFRYIRDDFNPNLLFYVKI